MIRRVASHEGERRFKAPIGTPIVKKTNISQLFTSQVLSLNFEQAKQALESSQHEAFMKKASEINWKYGAKTLASKSMIGDTAQYGTENSIMQRLRIDAGTSRTIAAEKGLAGHQLSVLNFVHDKKGRDLLVHVSMPRHLASQELRDVLNKRGLEFRSIDPDTNELVFYSHNGDMLAEIRQLAKDYTNGRLVVERGRGEFVGSDESREEAANVYRGILERWRRNRHNRIWYGHPNYGLSTEASALERLVKLAKVRTPEGVKKFHQSIGSVIHPKHRRLQRLIIHFCSLKVNGLNQNAQ